MSSPAIYGGSRTKILTSKGLLLKDGTPIDYNGQKNYITKGTFATNATTGWSLKRTTLSGLIPNQVAASWTTPSVLTLSATSTGALTQAGFSLSLAASGVTTAGDMLVSDPYTIDIEDQGKTLAFKFSYKAYTNPTNLVFAGNSTNTFHVYIYDDANSAWIQPTGCYSTVQSSGVGIATGTFQTPANMTSFRIAIVSCNASLNTTGGGAFTMYFDNFSVGPQITNMGVPVTDWVSYTPTGSWTTNTTYSGKWRRIGDSAEIQIVVSLSGNPTAKDLTVNLPSGMAIDASKISPSTENKNLGRTSILDVGVVNYQGYVGYNTTTSVVLGVWPLGPSFVQSNAITNLVPFSFGSGDYIWATITVPIVGWSSNTVMSSDAAVNVVAASASGTKSSTTTLDKITLTPIADSTNSFLNNEWTVPVSGYYSIQAFGSFTTNNASLNDRILYIYIDGVSNTSAYTTTSYFGLVSIQTILKLNAGQKISFYGHSVTIAGSLFSFRASIERISGPQSIAASETVAARYTNTAGTAIGTGTTGTAPLDFATKDYDYTNSVTTGAAWKFTAPISGLYKVSVQIYWSSLSWTGTLKYLRLRKNGSDVNYMGLYNPSAAYTGDLGLIGSDTIRLLAGDYIDLRVVHQEATTKSLGPVPGTNYITIERVGNY